SCTPLGRRTSRTGASTRASPERSQQPASLRSWMRSLLGRSHRRQIESESWGSRTDLKQPVEKTQRHVWGFSISTSTRASEHLCLFQNELDRLCLRIRRVVVLRQNAPNLRSHRGKH